MAYKDQDKQREANKAANKRYRDKQKGITADGVSREGITGFENVAASFNAPGFGGLPVDVQSKILRISDSPDEIAGRTANALHYQRVCGVRSNTGTDIGPFTLPVDYQSAGQLPQGEHNRVSVPGDEDYDGICTPEWIAEHAGIRG